MATSITGKTTSGQDGTSWVESPDIERMDAEMIDCGVMIMGKKTYESFGNDLPIGKALLVIMTQDKGLLGNNQDGIIFTDKHPRKVIEMISGKGFSKALLAGGEKLNSSFLKNNLINEIRVIIKPLIIGQGKSLFDVKVTDKKLKLVSSTQLTNDSIELVYEVLGSTSRYLPTHLLHIK